MIKPTLYIRHNFNQNKNNFDLMKTYKHYKAILIIIGFNIAFNTNLLDVVPELQSTEDQFQYAEHNISVGISTMSV